METTIKTPSPSLWHRTSVYQFLRWISNPRTARRFIIAGAWVVAIAALYYGEENLRGRRAWNQYRQATEASGESLDLASYIPKPVPDDQNFAATPFLQSFMLQTQSPVLTNDFYARVSDHIKLWANTNGQRRFEDLVAWQEAWSALQNGNLPRTQKFASLDTSPAARAAAAAAVLPVMKSGEAEFAELRAASSREFSRFSLKYDMVNPWSILLPHLAKIKQASEELSWEACAELAASQQEQALPNVKLGLSLTDSIKTEPFMISLLVRVACLQIAVQPVWEGLAEHRWTDGQLTELQSRFLGYDFLTDALQPLKAERATVIPAVDVAKKGGIGMLGSDDRTQKTPLLAINLISRLIPSGWYDLEELNYCLRFDAQTKGAINLAAKQISPSQVAANERELGEKPSPLQALLHHQVLASMLVPSFNHYFEKVAIAQVTADQAALACALERYRLANGQYPETLQALAPKFIARIPHDVIGGQPYKYRRTDDGKFILYSIGWNEKDDGGVPGQTLFDTTQGDWVWSYPTR